MLASWLSVKGERVAISDRLSPPKVPSPYASRGAEDDNADLRNVEYRVHMAIYYMYMDVFGAPDECLWRGNDRVISLIVNSLFLKPCQQQATFWQSPSDGT